MNPTDIPTPAEYASYPLTYASATIDKSKFNLIYENEMQQSIAGQWRPRKMGCTGGRGTGKSSLLSDHAKFCYYTIPRGTDVLLSASYRMSLGVTLPTMLKELEQKHHLVEGRDYTRCHAPAKLGFDEPLYKPRSWNNAIHWRNGMVTLVLSGQVKSAANGLNICSLRTDEGKFINYPWYCDSVKPAIRGAIYDHPGWRKNSNEFYTSEWWVSDKGVTVEQTKWEKGFKEMVTQDINDELSDMIAEYEVARREGWSHELRQTPLYQKRLHELRSLSTAFFNFPTLANIEVLGGGADPENYIKELKRSMAPLLFDIVIMGRDVTQKTIDTYYKNFEEDVHCYSPSAATEESILNGKFQRKFKTKNEAGTRIEWEASDLDEISAINHTCYLDADLDEDAPVLLGYDFNHGVNCLVVGQQQFFEGQNSCLILKTMYNTDSRRLEGLCEDFCRYYVYKKVKAVVVFYDSTAKQGGAYASQFSDDFRFYNIINRILTAHGWEVTLVDLGAPLDHDVKYEFINDCFAGKKGIMPRINREKNDLLIASMQNSKMYYGQGGKPRKDKSLEKTHKNSPDEDIKLRVAATDITDALDTLLWGCVKTQGNYTATASRWGVHGVPIFGISIR